MTFATREFKRAARIILIGAPGVGKGTQTERLLAKFPQLASISSGDLLRENVRNKTPLGVKAEATMQSGNLVPDSLILDLISAEFRSKGWLSTAPTPTISPAASFILDGFPRTATQASTLDSLVPVNFVVHLVTPPSVILSRIASRWIHEPSGRVYNTDFNAPKVPGKDDVTGEPLTQREDDSIDTWKQRLHKFEETSKALIDHYRRKGCLWRVEGNTSDEISPRLFAEIERRFC
ncbi:adenylate kinase 2 [Aspergillus terreus NIH2624]|uniref:GTP:AMP phosphotransferase, mitochondrial n=1 Tax=Aspergillus terreus (strain NIH 2624 / FGSC A1156) TaxID=341663 RepID=Q0CUT9_ASPTN|nr:adenylate kinase 2 [Aspergillus terreus NIH2624]EAU37507.1 adenylate kinase 2 [Aspergillus terreus NIH2624]